MRPISPEMKSTLWLVNEGINPTLAGLAYIVLIPAAPTIEERARRCEKTPSSSANSNAFGSDALPWFTLSRWDAGNYVLIKRDLYYSGTARLARQRLEEVGFHAFASRSSVRPRTRRRHRRVQPSEVSFSGDINRLLEPSVPADPGSNRTE